ncbi:MAG: type II toxin-antitoxin system PemK/MazF family toxin [Cyclobacteriaceae bacterium]|nr:type II toxin-antitoxin system PemK/MazF family toxin [Cyclobacteriaceae bacterium]
MKKGDIVLLPFPFTDLSNSKLRPAVILVVSEQDVVVAFITSQIKWNLVYAVTLSPSLENGLKVESYIRLNKLATIDLNLVVGKLGSLTNAELSLLDQELAKMLAINLE